MERGRRRNVHVKGDGPEDTKFWQTGRKTPKEGVRQGGAMIKGGKNLCFEKKKKKRQKTKK